MVQTKSQLAASRKAGRPCSEGPASLTGLCRGFQANLVHRLVLLETQKVLEMVVPWHLRRAELIRHCDFLPSVHSLQSKVYGKLLSTPKYPLKDADGHTLKKGQRVQIKVRSAASSYKRLPMVVDSTTQLNAVGMPH